MMAARFTTPAKSVANGLALLLAIFAAGQARSAQLLAPSIDISSRIISDGISRSNPRAIPASIVEYELLVANIPAETDGTSGPAIVNPIPAQLSLFVGDIGTGNGPFVYETTNGASGFECRFETLSSMSDCVEFSDDGGQSFDYVPAPDRQGFDPDITHLRFRLKAGQPLESSQSSTFVLRYRMRME